jgi:hypothetical protein
MTKHICKCGHDYAAHFNGNDETDLECFYCDCKEFVCEDNVNEGLDK